MNGGSPERGSRSKLFMSKPKKTFCLGAGNPGAGCPIRSKLKVARDNYRVGYAVKARAGYEDLRNTFRGLKDSKQRLDIMNFMKAECQARERIEKSLNTIFDFRRMSESKSPTSSGQRSPGADDDPLVFEPPPEQIVKRSTSKPEHPKPVNGEEKPGRRMYDRPWKKPPKNERSEKANSEKANKNERIPDIMTKEVRGEGTCVDQDLIDMIKRDCLETNPDVRWDDVAGHQDTKATLEEALVLPVIMPDYFTGIRRPWKGVLMFGPPGTGKTLLAKAVATECGTSFFSVSSTTLASKYRGDSEKLVRILFTIARENAPTTLFFDEIDALGGARCEGEHEASRRVKSELLVQMDGVNAGDNDQKNIMVLAASNRPWDLDEALRRRLEKRVYIPLPDEKTRKLLFKIKFATVPCEEGLEFDEFISQTEGYSGADIDNVCREASLMGMRKRINSLREEGRPLIEIKDQTVNDRVTSEDIREALKNISRSVGGEDKARYETWMQQYGAT